MSHGFCHKHISLQSKSILRVFWVSMLTRSIMPEKFRCTFYIFSSGDVTVVSTRTTIRQVICSIIFLWNCAWHKYNGDQISHEALLFPTPRSKWNCITPFSFHCLNCYSCRIYTSIPRARALKKYIKLLSSFILSCFPTCLCLHKDKHTIQTYLYSNFNKLRLRTCFTTQLQMDDNEFRNWLDLILMLTGKVPEEELVIWHSHIR